MRPLKDKGHLYAHGLPFQVRGLLSDIVGIAGKATLLLSPQIPGIAMP